ncbi:MAG: protein-disulfide reductase DsbD [Oleiphilaceae bacterium]|nr:protein-disulfide reductase DsbD [Oleiphilaceae bacterium]
MALSAHEQANRSWHLSGPRSLCGQRCGAVHTLVALLLVLVASCAQAFPGGSGQPDFLPVEQAFPFNAFVDDGELVLEWRVTEEHYLYRDRFELDVQPGELIKGEPRFSAETVMQDDPYFGQVPVFEEDVQMRLSMDPDSGVDQARVSVTWQGCAKAGLCYPPQTENWLYIAEGNQLVPSDESGDSDEAPRTGDSTVGKRTATDNATGGGSGLGERTASGLQSVLEQDSLWLIAGLFFLLGLGLTFTPCVLPMIPIISAVVAGQRQLSTPQAFTLSLSYVLGMAITYAGAGVLVGLMGASFNVQAWLQAPWVLGTFAALFTLLALAMFGVFELRLPAVLQDRLTRKSQNLTGGRVASVFGIGSLSALIVSPCVTAPLAAALVFISATQDALVGGIALLFLGLGMGTPLLLIGTGGQRFMPRPGPWMDGIKALFGVLMLAVAIWLLERVVPGPVALLLWALLLAVAGVQLGAFEPTAAGWARTRKGLGLVIFAGAMMLLAGALAGGSDPTRPLAPFMGSAESEAGHEAPFTRLDSVPVLEERLEQARRQGQPVILDLYADWCISCKIMERRVFSDPQVARQMSRYTRLQLDVTENTRPQRLLLDRYGLFGPPSLLFFSPEGEELTDLRVVGEMDRNQFSERLARVSQRVFP